MKNFQLDRFLWALTFILVGAALLADNLGFVPFDIWKNLFKLWPLFIIIPGLNTLFKGKLIWGGILTIGGASFLISNFTSLDMWEYIWPLLIILLGVSFLMRPARWNSVGSSEMSKENRMDETVVFGGVEKRYESKDFQGGSIDTIFGGSQIDLRDIELGSDRVKLEVNSVFGGTEVWVNTSSYKVIAEGTGVFGGWTNKFGASKVEKPVLEISGAAVFGGVEIKD